MGADGGSMISAASRPIVPAFAIWVCTSLAPLSCSSLRTTRRHRRSVAGRTGRTRRDVPHRDIWVSELPFGLCGAASGQDGGELR